MEIINNPLNWMERRRARPMMSNVFVPSIIILLAMTGFSMFVHSHRRQLIHVLTRFKQVALLLYLVCTLACSHVVWKAYHQNQQFYPTYMCLLKSAYAVALYHVQTFMCVFWVTTWLCKLFLGTLCHAELDNLVQSLCHSFPEMILIYTFVPGVIDSTPLEFFSLFIFLKSFHWLTQKRVDILRRTVWFRWMPHIRVALLCLLLIVVDCILIGYIYGPSVTRPTLMRMVMCFECTIMLTVVLCTATKHFLQIIEECFGWEGHRSTLFLICTDLVSNFIKLLLYLLLLYIMTLRGPPPLFGFQAMLFELRDLIVGLYNLWCSWRAIRHLNSTSPDVAPNELDDADVCVICRESLTVNAKKLPCGHIFHTNCIYDWYLRQHSCPVCRFNVLGTTRVAANQRAPNEQRQIDAAEARIMSFGPPPSPESVPVDDTESPPPLQFQGFYRLPYIMTPLIVTNLSDFSTAELKVLEKTLFVYTEQRLQDLRQINEFYVAANGLMEIYRIAALRTLHSNGVDGSRR